MLNPLANLYKTYNKVNIFIVMTKIKYAIVNLL
jgi:hypothetical protein